jgi:glutamyl-tRNA reductase
VWSVSIAELDSRSYPTIAALHALSTINLSSSQAIASAFKPLTMTDAAKRTVLVIGGGAVGAIAALNLDVGGLAEVTIVLRSNYEAVQKSGYDFESCDHGAVSSWKPSVGMCQLVRSCHSSTTLDLTNTDFQSVTPSPTSSKRICRHMITSSSPPKTFQISRLQSLT